MFDEAAAPCDDDEGDADVLFRNFPRVLDPVDDGVFGTEDVGDGEGAERNLPRRGAAMGAGLGGAMMMCVNKCVVWRLPGGAEAGLWGTLRGRPPKFHGDFQRQIGRAHV